MMRLESRRSGFETRRAHSSGPRTSADQAADPRKTRPQTCSSSARPIPAKRSRVRGLAQVLSIGLAAGQAHQRRTIEFDQLVAEQVDDRLGIVAGLVVTAGVTQQIISRAIFEKGQRFEPFGRRPTAPEACAARRSRVAGAAPRPTWSTTRSAPTRLRPAPRSARTAA